MYNDKVDEKIIEYLKENSRESFVDIGKKLKLSESAVRRRVKNLLGAQKDVEQLRKVVEELYTIAKNADADIARLGEERIIITRKSF